MNSVLAAETKITSLSSEKARALLTNILEAIELPENATKLAEAKSNAGNDMLKMMQFVFPIVMKIEMEVIKNYGFADGRQELIKTPMSIEAHCCCWLLLLSTGSTAGGIVHYAQLIRSLEREDPEISLLHTQVRGHYLPPVTICTDTAS